MKGKAALKRHWVFLLILLAAAGVYGAVLATSQSRVDGDEAVVGVMARHIMTRGERPIFFYGQAYGGGGAIEAYLATIPFALFGDNAISLKLVGLVISLATLVATYFFCLSIWGRRMALVTTAILAAASPLVEWHTKMRGGYVGLMLSSVVILWVYMKVARSEKARGGWFVLLGVLCGLAVYNKELILPLLLALGLAAGARRDLFLRPKAIGLTLFGGLVGAFPLVYYNLTNGFRNVRYVLGIGTRAEEGVRAGLVAVLFKYLPAFFHPRNVDQYVNPTPAQSWIEYALYVGLAVFAGVVCRGALRRMFTDWLPKKEKGKGKGKKHEQRKAPEPEAILLTAVVIHLLACAMSSETSKTPRYFLALFPALPILAGSAIARLWEMKSGLKKGIGVAAFLALLGIGIAAQVSYIRPPMVTDDFGLYDARTFVRQTSPETLDEIIAYLRQEGVSHVMCTYFLQWRILFESHETIIASSNGMHPGRVRYPEYDDRVAWADRVGLILHRESGPFMEFENSELARELKRKDIGPYAVYVPPVGK
jgi:4-amino-4-deoxy-L-arabinose transferase-like glycosyltransferase